jgi:hypothetical protein
MEWFVRNHLVGGFLKSKSRKLCNAKFVTVGDEVFVVATKDIRRGSEVFVHYKVRECPQLNEIFSISSL